jgi:hypothetical protein
MRTSTRSRRLSAALALVAVGLVGAAFAATTNAEAQSEAKQRSTEQLVVRGEATVLNESCDAGICKAELTDGTFRGTPVGTGAYTGTFKLKIAEAFPNGEGGLCAPFRSTIVLGAGTPDRLVLALAGISCQDGAGDPTKSTFTNLAQFTVRYGTGSYAHARGSGLAISSEDAADRDRMTLIGQISR